jgi:hypothetical protein
MKKILFSISLLALIWHCSDKNPLDIKGSSVQLKSPTEKPTINRSDYTLNGSFLPGHQNGKIRSDRIILDWPNSTDNNFLCYKVYRNNVERSTITDQTLNTYLDSNLVQNTYYDYRIITMNKSGMFKSDTIKLKTPLFQPPTNLGYQVLSTSSIKLLWENLAESASSFDIERKLSNEPDTAFQQIGTVSDTFYTDNSVTNMEQYRYRIRAYNNYETTGYSYSLYVYVNYVLTTPSLYSVNQVSGTRSVLIKWYDNSNAEDGVLIYRRKAGQNLQIIGTVSTNVTEYFDHDTTGSLKVDSTYYYAVRAYNVLNNDTSNYSTEYSIAISEPSSFTPYTEDFENPLGSEWTLNSSTIYGRIQRISGDPLPYSGQYQLLMDVSTAGNYNYNYAYLNIDLSALSSTDNCYLKFYYHTFDEEFNPGDDAVFVSSDGINFTLVYDLYTSDSLWTNVDINLKDFYTLQPYSSAYTILWQQYDNFTYPSDGIGIDDIEIDIN